MEGWGHGDAGWNDEARDMTRSMRDVLHLVQDRSAQICAALERAGDDDLHAPTSLPGWDRLTLMCHLRYGAHVTRQMISATLEVRPSAFYPGGRAFQRSHTLEPERGESPHHVLPALHEECAALHASCLDLTDDQWRLRVIEPEPGADLGPVTLAELMLLRLTELQVHGSDLLLGLPEWPPEFGPAVLAQRASRVRLAAGASLSGRLRLLPVDAADLVIVLDGPEARVLPDDDGDADASLAATANDLVAVLLGRLPATAPRAQGDPELAAGFLDSVVGP